MSARFAVGLDGPRAHSLDRSSTGFQYRDRGEVEGMDL